MLLQKAEFHSFLWLSNIPVCVCMCVCVCARVRTHIFFIHSSVDGTLRCFHIYINSAAMNTRVHAFFKWVLSFSSDIYPAVDHMVVLLLVFRGISILFSTVAAWICNPTDSVLDSVPFFHILANIYLCSFWREPYWQVWGDISLWFWVEFLWRLVMLSFFFFFFFMCLLATDTVLSL